MRFYLSGGMEFKEGLGIAWREWLTEELAKLGHSTIDPTQLEKDENISGPVQVHVSNLKLRGELDKVREIVRHNLFRKDMYGVQLSDAMVVLYDESARRGAGTLSETWEAFREGRPVYLVTSYGLEDLPTWLIGETTDIFPDFESLLKRLADITQLTIDVKEAKKIRDEVLGGVYKT